MATKTQIVPATREHAEELAATMRVEDQDEVLAFGFLSPLDSVLASLERSNEAWALLFDGKVAALFGLSCCNPLTGFASPWLLSSTLVEKHRFAFLRACRPTVKHWLKTWPTLANCIDGQYEKAVRWVEWLGFTVEKSDSRLRLFRMRNA